MNDIIKHLLIPKEFRVYCRPNNPIQYRMVTTNKPSDCNCANCMTKWRKAPKGKHFQNVRTRHLLNRKQWEDIYPEWRTPVLPENLWSGALSSKPSYCLTEFGSDVRNQTQHRSVRSMLSEIKTLRQLNGPIQSGGNPGTRCGRRMRIEGRPANTSIIIHARNPESIMIYEYVKSVSQE